MDNKTELARLATEMLAKRLEEMGEMVKQISIVMDGVTVWSKHVT